MRVTMPLVYESGSWRVRLPTYQMVPGTEDYQRKTVVVDVPDDECDRHTGRPCPDLVRAKYRGNPKWDRGDLVL